MRRVLLLAGLVAALFSAVLVAQPAARAQDCSTAPPQRLVSDNEVNRVSKNLYCPVCENVPLEVCPTEACQRWREQVRDLLARGCTREQVEQYFVARFGQKTVGVPTNPTTQLLTIVLPLTLIGVMGIGVGILLLRWRRSSALAGPPLEPFEAVETVEAVSETVPFIDDEHRDRLERALEEELRKRY